MKSFAPTMSIGELARLAECRVDTIRYYERIGLMPKPERTEGRQRRYGEQDARQLLFIRRLRDLGFSVDEASGFLALRRRQVRQCADFKQIADARVAEIRQQMRRLRRLERRLRDVSAQCAEGAITHCGVIEALWGADGLDADLPARAVTCCSSPGKRGDA